MTKQTPEDVIQAIILHINDNSLGWRSCTYDLNYLLTIIQAQREQAVAEATKWQPIETAPRDGATILLCYQHPIIGYRVASGEWYEKDGGYFDCEGYRNPTHWMPLPILPEDIK